MEKTYDIEGMTCSACSRAVERAVGKLEGVIEVEVNLITNQMNTIFDENILNKETIIEAIHKVGYEAAEKTDLKEVSIPIEGMTCASCVRAVEKSINKLDGIEEVSINITTNKAYIKYDSAKARVSNIKQSIKKAGYKPLTIEKDNDESYVNENEKQYRKMRRELYFAFAFTIPLLYIAMGDMIGLPSLSYLSPEINPINFTVIQMILTVPVIFIGRNFYKIGFRTLIKGSPNMDSLIAVGTSAAIIFSIFASYQIFNGNHNYIHQLYFETGVTIITLIKFGKTLEFKAKGKTSEAISKLIKLKPKVAVVINKDGEIVLPIEEIEIGDIVLVKPGEMIPVDGEIVEGFSDVDESMLTGESIPVDKELGNSVISGSVNGNGMLKINVMNIDQDTFLNQIIKVVEDAQNKKAPITRLADIIAGYFVPIVIGIAIIASIAWFVLERDISFSLKIFISVLVIACPCALGLATPTAIMVGTGKGAENGILIKSGEALEMLHKVTTIVLDKTGTITEGKPIVKEIISFGKYSKEDILIKVASLERFSEHPIGKSIIEYHGNMNLTYSDVIEFVSIPGKGLVGNIDGEIVKIGNGKLIKNKEKSVEKMMDKGMTIVYLEVNNELTGAIGISDNVKRNSENAIKKLHSMGLEVIMLTGDNIKAADYIATEVGVDRVIAGVLPEEKSQVVGRLKDEKKIVAMVGDGINDSPSLVVADVGIAMGTGTDVAIESADIVLIKSDLEHVVKAIYLSKKTINNIKQNLFWAFAYNVAGIPIAAGVLYLLFNGPLLNPMFAALAMSFSSVSVVTNALRLKSINLEG